MSEARLRLDYFDGRSAKPHSAEIWLAAGQLHLQGLEQRSWPARRVRWPERARHGRRQALLPDGGVLSCDDARAWDDWARQSGLHESATVRAMQSWRLVVASLALLVAVLAAGWRWGVPAAADVALTLLPVEAEREVGEQALAWFDGHLLKSSQLAAARQDELRRRFERAATAALPTTGPQPGWRLHFRDGGKRLGPNAFALPGGDIVITDALVELLADQPDALVGVLAHELGHVQRRHGMRLTVQAGLVAAAAGVIVGDFSSLLAGAPALLAQQSYSHDFEREADDYARRLMRGAGLSPRAMVQFFERVGKLRDGEAGSGGNLPIAISSHPADEERIRFFSE